MSFEKLIDSVIKKELKVFINGIPDENGGKILERNDDYIKFEVIKQAKIQEDTTRENIFIPVNQIWSISKGEEKVSVLNCK